MAATSSLQSDKATPPTEVRCHCGSLMARLTEAGLELKCRRCKRVVVVAADRAREDWVDVRLDAEEA